MTKFEAFHWCFVTKLNTHKSSPFCGKLKIFSDFLLHFRAFRHLFEKFNTFWYQMGYLYILEPIREPPAILKNFLDIFFRKWLYIYKKYTHSVICCFNYSVWSTTANFRLKIILKFEILCNFYLILF